MTAPVGGGDNNAVRHSPPPAPGPPSKERRGNELSRFHEIGERSESMT